MAEEPLVIRGINWREAFPFTHIFRSFRIAIHPSKLALGFMALVALYLGGRILDGVWMDKYRAVPGEIERYQVGTGGKAFDDWVAAQRDAAVGQYTIFLQALNKPNLPELNDLDKAKAAAKDHKYTKDVKWAIVDARDKRVKLAEEQYEAARKAPKFDQNAAAQTRDSAIQAAYARAHGELRAVSILNGRGLFEAFMEYQTGQINNVWRGVLSANWLGGLQRGERFETPGVLLSTYNFFTAAPGWALANHWLYFLLFGALFLVVWSLFGGAIARIAAVHVADEGRKLSVRQGLGFSVSKFLSFISAPMIPLIIVVGIGLAIAVVSGVAFLIPWVGEIVVGALFILALAGGFVMALVLLGMIGGFNLMYPTIAVEGSDSFDAISRSFSYVYSKPWRMLFYSLVAIAYGSLTYLFARLFIWLVLVLTHFFVGLLVFRHANDGGAMWTTMFPQPSWDKLPFEYNVQALGWAGRLAAFLVAIWSYTVISLLGALAISLYFSTNTIIYYLMRKEVDATEMDDVYLEQPEEEFAETPGVATQATDATAATTAPAAPPATPAPTIAPAETGATTPPTTTDWPAAPAAEPPAPTDPDKPPAV